MQKEYKGFTKEQRMANLKKVKQAIKDGLLPDPNTLKCEICGQNQGIREYHCFDYTPENAMKCLKCLCYKCHRYLHINEIGESNKWYNYSVYYFKRVKEGFIFPARMKY